MQDSKNEQYFVVEKLKRGILSSAAQGFWRVRRKKQWIGM